MKITSCWVVFAAWAAVWGGVVSSEAAASEGVAVAIIYDTSGSMRETVNDSGGKRAAKYVVANRALKGVARQIEAFATNAPSGASRKVEAGLFVFQGNNARMAVKFGPFNAAALEEFANTFASPNGNTPLGNALSTAVKTVLDSPLPRKHVLVITDGLNTAGPDPESVLPALKQRAQQRGSTVGVHFVAFDIAAKQFEPVKRQGATVVGAANEAQLNTQLEYILQRKILLEDEEPKK